MSAGSRWFKFDLHTHTPYSFDYGRGGGATSITPEQWLLSFIDAGIECVAITDHNSGAAIDTYKMAAGVLANQGKDITVFPGVEISVSGNVHILGIFDPSCTSNDITALLGAVGYRGSFGDSDAVTQDSAEVVVEKIHRLGGVAIPAHIDRPAGFCVGFSGLTLKQSLEKVDAVEVIDRNATNLHAYRTLKLDLAELIGSDSHKASEVGRAFTWLKMSVPDISGLRLALIDGSLAVKRSDETNAQPNAAPSMAVVSLTVNKTKYCGMAKPMCLEFSPWLNSIIGGRGSGKSSLVEFMRLVTGRGNELGNYKVLAETFTQLARVPTSNDPEGLLRADSLIDLVYRKDDQYYKVTYQANSPLSIERWINGAWFNEPGSVTDRFPVRIFSQKQIFELSKNPNVFLQIIDESSVVRYSEWLLDFQRELGNFDILRANERSLLLEIQQRSSLQGKLEDLRAKFAKYNSANSNPAIINFKRLDFAKRHALDFINGTLATVDGITTGVDRLVPYMFPPETPPASNAEAELEARLANVSLAVSQLQAQLTNALSTFESKLQSEIAWIENSEFNSELLQAFTQYQSAMNSIAESGIQDWEQYQAVEKEITVVEEALKKIDLAEEQRNKVLELISSSFYKLISMRGDLTNRRLEFINTNLRGSAAINVELIPFSAMVDSERSFRVIIGRPDRTFASDICDPEAGVGLIFNLKKQLESEATVQDKLDLIRKFKEDLLLRHAPFGVSLGKRFSDFLTTVDESIYDRLWCWFPEDEISISFSEKGKFKNISMGSAGQKTATILSLLLSYGVEPLILDQPEDDLDNKLIGSLIIDSLKSSKSVRQMIVVTHNPNIVVNGDSELVIALDDIRGQTYAVANGGLQESKVREHVCDVMEGGKIALENRYKRIGMLR